MSEARAKATRRDLRRALGDSGLSVVQAQGTVLDQHARIINTHSSRLAKVEVEAARSTDYQVERGRQFSSLGGRLRWLLLGA